MSFDYKITNYSEFDMPYYILDIPIGSTANASITHNNIKYSFKTATIIDYEIGTHLTGYTINDLKNKGAVWACKSKKEDGIYKYCKIELPILNSSTPYKMIKLCNDLSEEGVVLTNQTTYTQYTGYMCVFETQGFLFFGLTFEFKGRILMQATGVEKTIIEFFLNEIDGTEKDPELGDPSEPDGYEPDPDPTSDEIPIPDPPQIGVSNVGFVNVYKTDKNNLLSLGSMLFPDFTPPPPIEIDDSIPEMIGKGFETLTSNISNLLNSYINSNLINYIIDCHCVPVNPPTSGTEPLKIGFKEFPITAHKVSSDYVDFDCGTLSIKEYYGNFIDYVGTRAQLYLPFIGFVPIKNEFFQNGLLQVTYRFNIVDGSFMCYVLSSSSKSDLSNSVVATYSGNACIHLPITGVNYSNIVSGVISGVSSIPHKESGGVNVGGAVSTAVNSIALKPEMQQSNSYNATSAYLGIRYPYLMIEREVSNFSKQYHVENGLPLNVTKRLGDMTGYVQMDNIHMNGITCTEEEKNMILEMLTSGVIV